MLGNVSNAYFPAVLEQLGVDEDIIQSFSETMEKEGSVLIPQIILQISGEERVYSLLSARTHDETFSYLNGVQGQFVERTVEYELRKEHDRLVEEKDRDRVIIEEKSKQLETLANRLAKYLSPQIYDTIFAGTADATQSSSRKNLTNFPSDIEAFTETSAGVEPERVLTRAL